MVIASWDKLFLLTENKTNLLRCMNYFHAAAFFNADVVKWMRSFPSSFMAVIIVKLHELL